MNLKKSLVITSILSSMIFTGCSKDDVQKNASNSTSKDKGELSIFLVNNGKPFDAEWEIYQEASKKNNVKLTSYASKTNTDSIQSFNLMVASNNLADLISHRMGDLEKLGTQGGVIPLNDLIDKHAPNLKKFMEENPELRKTMVSADGKIYTVPTFYDFYKARTSYGLFMRTDWLKKYNLPVPTNLDELKTALTTFREQDANGNGKKDEIGIFIRGNSRNALESLMSIFGCRPSKTFYVAEDGKINFVPLDPNYKESIKIIAQWYKDGLIDPEVFTRGWGARDAVLPTNLGAMTSDWFGSTANYNNLSSTIPGFEFLPIKPIQIKEGLNSRFMARNTTNEWAWAISAQAKDPVKAMEFMDWWFSPEGRRTWNFGIENKHYTMVDGQPIFTDYVLKNENGKSPLQVLQESGAQIAGIGVQQDVEYENQWTNEIAKKGSEMYMEPGVMTEPMPILKFTTQELKDYEKIMANVNQITEEHLQKWILGSGDVDKEWDAYVAQIKQNNLNKAIEIVQTSYDRYKAIK
ncbi:extracellular solute-binding protein [Cetobacterium sp. SF1]|uniref:extracellular solute-binding protein n=1 Tax=unclassified Cetobacterium TaxID=2630983 RepID=UPI003CEA7DAD